MYSPHKMARHLSTYISDRGAIAAHLSREFGVTYQAKDIARLLSNSVESVPRDARNVGEPIGYNPPISSVKRGHDALAEATNAYIARNAKSIRKALAK